MKIGIVIDSWKLSIFERRLKAAGYTFTQSPGIITGTLSLIVITENLQALQVVVHAATEEAALTGPGAI